MNKIYTNNFITSKIETLINKENLKAGDKLPSENELMKRFNLPRSVIRSEIQKLVGLGILETFQGKGVFISSKKEEIFYNSIFKIFFNQLDNYDLKHLLQLRLLIEPTIMEDAAKNFTPQDFYNLKLLIENQISNIGNEENFIIDDFEFHRAIAQLSSNPFMIKVYELILVMFRSFHLHFFKNFSNFEEVISNHKKILNLIKNNKSQVLKCEITLQLLNYLDVVDTFTKKN